MHLNFCMELYKMQHQNGLYFLREHPKNASSWNEKKVLAVLLLEGCEKVNGDMCMYNMNYEGQPIRKPTSFMTNAREIADALSKGCDKKGTQAYTMPRESGKTC